MPSFLRVLGLFSLTLLTLNATLAAEPQSHRFDRILLSEEFRSEGAAFADFDGDGDNDIVSGNVWYEGPEYRVRHEYMPGSAHAIVGYSQHFFSWTHDFNGDQRPDILVVGFPAAAAKWFENPGRKDGHWKEHVALAEASGESPDFEDINGDGRPDLVCVNDGRFGYAQFDPAKPNDKWSFTAVTPKGGFGGFTHGLGLGDVNKDGRVDLLETNGWWEQSATAGELFSLRPQRFAQSGGADVLVSDFDGDGDNDVLSSQNAHGYGLSWFENRGNGGAWVPHAIMTAKFEDNPYGLAISQMHALALVDIDGDGIQDVVTGKRFYAHAGGDPGLAELPVLYWFQTKRGANGVEFIPHLIDDNSGVGTQVTVGDLNADGLPDILIGCKRGTFLFLHRAETVTAEKLAMSLPKPQQTPRHLPGMPDFANGVRSTDALDPEAERKTFVLPQGFEARLVAAEPDIQKPLNLAFDARGRLWCSMSLEYPYAAPLDKEGRDVIKVLEDTNGDGRADKITTFADKLNIPIGLYPYQDGVICHSIPNIWFLRDTDGDGVCDKREILYGPVGWERDTHGMCNAFRRGFDGWLYSCHGFNNHTSVKGRDGHTITMQSGNTFRMRLDGERVEHFTHGQVNPFGQCFDPFGNIFTADCHTKPITLLLQGGHYESFGKPHDGLGYVPNVMEHLHGSTAIAAVAQCNTSSFPPVYRSNLFDGNVMTSRINRNSLVVSGSSVKAQEEPDFLTAGDSWFRPVDIVFGPDGAMYVSDFYNKIIGHYEVPLPHPGRDRFRGRIWKIAYVGDANRRDTPIAAPVQPAMRIDSVRQTPEFLVSQLAVDDLQRRMMIADRLVDHFGDEAIVPARAGLRDATSEFVRAHCLWVLFRLKALTDDELALSLADHNSPLVRTHACRVLGAMAKTPSFAVASLTKAFGDKHAQVRRAAVMTASTLEASDIFVRPLMTLFVKTEPSDVHLRHAIRMALRNQLRSEAAFAKLATEALSDADAELIAGISLALKTPASSVFLIKHLSKVPSTDRVRLVEIAKAAAGQASPENVGEIVKLATTRFADDRGLQLELLASVRHGLAQNATSIPPVVRDWALSLAKSLLHLGDAGKPLVWSFSPVAGQPDQGNCWVIQQRVSSDGTTLAPFFSSLVLGEQRTGISRSEAFIVGQSFHYFAAGHIGVPGAKIEAFNFVRLRDAKTHEILFERTPPRNDVAQKQVWDTTKHAGKSVLVELTDGDSRGAYAWLAVGRFSVEGLNPDRSAEDRRQGAQVVGAFGLTELAPSLKELLVQQANDRDTAAALAESLVQLKFDSRLSAVVETFKTVGASPQLRDQAAKCVAQGNFYVVETVLKDTLKVATSAEQLRIAERLASDEAGAGSLATLGENGHLTPSLLTRPTVQPKLAAIKNADLKKRLDALIASAPPEDAKIEALIKAKKAELTATPGKAELGALLFKKSCAICHQVGGQGAMIGANLDGIGNRGLERLLEDVLAPNRNVDIAFRTTTIVTKSGRVLSGLIKPSEGKELLLIDNQGKPQMIPLDEIEERLPSKLSLMPANFVEQVPPEDFRNLIAYLLTLRGS